MQLPPNLSARTLFDNIKTSSALEQRMFQAALKLKENGKYTVLCLCAHGCVCVILECQTAVHVH